MDLKNTRLGTNGAGRRKCPSWIESFIKHTDNLESAKLYRKWTAITVISAALEQNVWLPTKSGLYPNLYTVLVGYPGVGKTQTIMCGRAFLEQLQEFHIAPTSMKMASLVDALAAAKRNFIDHQTNRSFTYNSMTLVLDEWSAFMHAMDDELVGGLTTFYDVTVPYEHWRRGKDIKIKIERPQLTVLAGSTPSHLLRSMPDYVWEQGFGSRVLLVWSGERHTGDDFLYRSRELPADMVHDIKHIHELRGEFSVSDDYKGMVDAWREKNFLPQPTHPRLEHYCARRRAHLYKLSMVSAVDRGNELRLLAEDFRNAYEWLLEIETNMPYIFDSGTTTVDARAMDEIQDFIRRQGKPVPEHKVLHYAGTRIPSHAVVKVVQLMVLSGRIHPAGEFQGKPTFCVSDDS